MCLSMCLPCDELVTCPVFFTVMPAMSAGIGSSTAATLVRIRGSDNKLLFFLSGFTQVIGSEVHLPVPEGPLNPAILLKDLSCQQCEGVEGKTP